MGERRYVEGVMVSVGRERILSFTLPRLRKAFDHLIVVTGNDDFEVVNLCNGLGVEVVQSDDYRVYGDAFNKGRMLNRGLERLERFEWVVILDDDVIYPRDMVKAIREAVLEKCFLYYNWRKHWKGWSEGKKELVDGIYLKNGHVSDDGGPWGYFQLFWFEEAVKRVGKEELFPTCFPSAGGVDSWFAHKWREVEWQKLQCSLVLHLWHGEKWTGWNTQEVDLRGRWKWCGSSCWPDRYDEVRIVTKLPKPCMFRRLDILTLEQETVVLAASKVPIWRKPTRRGYAFYEWHWREIQ